MVDALVEQVNASGLKQVEIEAKFIEITQTNLKSWALIGSSVRSSLAIIAVSLDPEEPPERQLIRLIFLLLKHTGGPVGATQNGQPFGVNPVTAGNRSGTFGSALTHSMHCWPAVPAE